MSKASLNLNGNFELTLDGKNRVIVPQRFRSVIGNPVTLMRGGSDDKTQEEKHIRIASGFRWEELCEKFDAMDEDEQPQEYRKMRVIMQTSFSDITIDGQGRITIPGPLRDFAGLSREIVVAGSGRYLEIWDRAAFYEMVNA